MDDNPEAAGAPKTRNPLKRLYYWVLSWAERPSGTWALFGFSAAEASIFPIPPDVLMIALILGKREKAWWFATVCLVGSLVGAVIGYFIGWGLWATTQDFWYSYVFSEEKFHQVSQLYNDYGWLAVFSAALSPIPYKVFTITAGVVKLNLLTFLLASLVGRGARFFIVALLFWWIGEKAKPFIDRWFNWLALIFVILLVAGFWILSKVG